MFPSSHVPGICCLIQNYLICKHLPFLSQINRAHLQINLKNITKRQRHTKTYLDRHSAKSSFKPFFRFFLSVSGKCITQPRWMLERGILGSGQTYSVSFRPFRTLLVGGGLLGPYSLSGSPVIKQLMQMVTMVPGQGGQFQSVCFP